MIVKNPAGIRKYQSTFICIGSTYFHFIWLGEKKWAAPILDHILQDQSLDHNRVLDQDQDHILERRDTGELMCFWCFY